MTRKKKIRNDEWFSIFGFFLGGIAIGMIISLFINCYNFSVLIHNIAKAMCWGQGAFDGKLYFKTVGSSQQLILRCYYVKSYGILRKETVLGWLPKEMRE